MGYKGVSKCTGLQWWVMTQPEVDMAKKQVAGYILEKLGGLVAGCS